jgi:hypothetical protein
MEAVINFMESPNVYIVCGYRHAGGSYMMYQVGKIVEKHFGYRCIMADDFPSGEGREVWSHPDDYPQILKHK